MPRQEDEELRYLREMAAMRESIVGDEHIDDDTRAVLLEQHDKRADQMVAEYATKQLQRAITGVQVGTQSDTSEGDEPLVDGDGLPLALDWAEFWEMDVTGAEWLAEPLVPKGRQVALYSVAKVGKSLVSLDIAAALATGRPCLGQAARAPMSVVYVDMEMTKEDLMDRLNDGGYGPETDLSNLHYYLLPDLPPLDTVDGGAMLARMAIKHDAELVVVDTMARAVQGDEDDSDTYRAFYRHAGRELKAIGVALLRLDHAGKEVGRGQRGSSAKNDDVDLVWRLTADKEVLTFKATHRRITWVPEEVTIQRKDDPLRHVWNDDAWPAGTAEVAAELDLLDVPIDASARTAQKALKAEGKGRRMTVILAAAKYRRDEQRQRRIRETPSDTPKSTTNGNQETRTDLW